MNLLSFFTIMTILTDQQLRLMVIINMIMNMHIDNEGFSNVSDIVVRQNKSSQPSLSLSERK